MGTAQVATAVLTGEDGGVFARFPIAGFSLTQSGSALITESGAGATALFTGTRVPNGRISLDASGRSLTTVMEAARAVGKSTGAVATCEITHATPAAFLTHAENRKFQAEIAEGIVHSGVELVIGGGRRRFLPRDQGGVREDGKNLMEELRRQGYSVVTREKDLDTARLPLAALLHDEALPPAAKRTTPQRVHVLRALDLLSKDPDGFVLMVEGSQIDWACHDNQFDNLKAELRDFASAISAALDFAQSHPGTLVLVTADHETGGLTLGGTRPDGSDLSGTWATDDHTACMVPVFAFGTGAERFGGIHPNSRIGALVLEFLRH